MYVYTFIGSLFGFLLGVTLYDVFANLVLATLLPISWPEYVHYVLYISPGLIVSAIAPLIARRYSATFRHPWLSWLSGVVVAIAIVAIYYAQPLSRDLMLI